MKQIITTTLGLILISLTPTFSQQNIYQRALFHLSNRQHLEARNVLDSALMFEEYKNSAEAWFRKGEISMKLADESQSDLNKYLAYYDDAKESFERVRVIETINSSYYKNSTEYLDQIWKDYLKKAIDSYDRGEYSSTITFCDKAKQIYPDDLNTYIYTGQAAEKLNKNALVLENYYRLVDSGYYRENIFLKLIELEKQRENHKDVIRLCSISEGIFKDKSKNYFAERIKSLQRTKEYETARKTILDSKYFADNNSEILILLGQNYIYEAEIKQAANILEEIQPINDDERIELANSLFEVATASKYLLDDDKDGNQVKKSAKKYLERAKVLYSNVNEKKYREEINLRIRLIEKLLDKE